MMYLLFRSVWRIVVFLVGVMIIYVAYKIYPYAHEILPVYVIALVVYCVAAYLVIPFLTRLLHVVIKPDHVPLYATTRDGIPSDPVNLAIVAHSKTELITAMYRAGWYEADHNTFINGLRETLSIVCNIAYPNAPVSSLYLFNRPQDLAFELPIGDSKSARRRHHVRFWRLYEAPPRHNDHDHFTYYATLLRRFLNPIHRSVWIGAAIEDSHPIGIRRRGTLTHRINTDADAERDFIINSLKSQKLVKRLSITQRGEATKFRGQQFRSFAPLCGGGR